MGLTYSPLLHLNLELLNVSSPKTLIGGASSAAGVSGETWEYVEQEKVTTAWERSVTQEEGMRECPFHARWDLSPAVS